MEQAKQARALGLEPVAARAETIMLDIWYAVANNQKSLTKQLNDLHDFNFSNFFCSYHVDCITNSTQCDKHYSVVYDKHYSAVYDKHLSTAA